MGASRKIEEELQRVSIYGEEAGEIPARLYEK
jgi:hypothetical protein